MAFKTTIDTQWKGQEIKIQGKQITGKSAYEIGLVVEGQAKQLAARKYGYLAASINTQSQTMGDDVEDPSKYAMETDWLNSKIKRFGKIDKPTSSWLEVLVGTIVEYGPHIEFGTIKSNAQPFLRPALDLAKGKVLTIVKKNSKFIFKDYIKE
ncbi:MAG: hypothetical protein WC895_04140 [Candidatus Shapirobacteria bacterium]|jgi:hypothetical protein